MANIKSQIKRNRQSEVDRLRNRQVGSEINTRSKAAVSAASEGADDAGEALQSAISRIDKAAQKGMLHKRTAARRTSRVMRPFSSAASQAGILRARPRGRNRRRRS